ncbi:16517_t:CDS:1, partial [Acaulospora morrowiae]
MGTIKTDKETPFGSDQIEDNINDLKEKLRKDTSPLYQHLYSKVNVISIQSLTWKNPLASRVIRISQKLPPNLSINSLDACFCAIVRDK